MLLRYKDGKKCYCGILFDFVFFYLFNILFIDNTLESFMMKGIRFLLIVFIPYDLALKQGKTKKIRKFCNLQEWK